MEWSQNQKKIIKLRNKNMLVSAAAGSGKTTVLVERILNLIIEDNEDIDKFLIVTFTNAAASGMKQKIQQSLIKALQDGHRNKEHLRKQVNLLNRANISTIHSFCIDVVRKNFHVIGIDPNFRIGDVNEIEVLLQESIDEVLEEAYTGKSEGFVRLVESFTKNRGDTELCDIIKDIYKFILSFPEPMQWLLESVNMLKSSNNLKDSIWIKSISENLLMFLNGAKEALLKADSLCLEEDGPFVYLETLKEDLLTVENLIELLDFDFQSFIRVLHKTSFPKLKAVRGKLKEGLCPEKQEEVKLLRDDYKKIINRIRKNIPNKSFNEFGNDIEYMYLPMMSLYELIEKLDVVFKSKKLDKAIADFGDVEHYALEILRQPEINENYKNKFHYIFIDEYQDSNSLQEELISQIKKDNNLFMVGDVKQSIYRFRLADPGIFNEKSLNFPTADDGGNNIKIDLTQNFRSRKEILDGINIIFNNIMTQKLGEIDYNEEVFLNSGADFNEDENNYIELNIIDKNSNQICEDEEDDDLNSMKTAELEAMFAAQKVRQLINENTFIPGSNEFRKIKYNDIVILMRSVANWAGIFEEVFNNEGIPFYFDGGTGYFETVEIQVIMNLLKIIDNSRQDIPLLSVMRSPIGNFTTEDLVKIRVFNLKSNYIDAVEHYRNNCADNISRKLDVFVQKIEGWKKRSRYIHLYDFIWEVLMETGYYYFVGLLPKGKFRQANLRLLTDKAFEFEKTSMRGLFNFLRYVEKLRLTSGDMETAKTLGENDNVVRLMSVHKSKGLEFPVVILCGLSKKFNKTDTRKDILKHKSFGLAPKYINPESRIYKETLCRIAMKSVIRKENISEEMRVLYVAMTRAVDKLILVGTVDNAETKYKKWMKGTSLYNIYTNDSYIDWICLCIFSNLNNDEKEKILNNKSFLHKIDYKINKDLYSSLWKINRIFISDMKTENKKILDDEYNRRQEISKFGLQINNDKDTFKEITRRLNFDYPFKNSVNVPTKMSVTDIKMLKNEKLDRLKYKIPPLRDIPQFKENVEFSKAEIGTIVHFIMQHLTLDRNMSENNISHQINEMVNKRMLTEQEAKVADVKKIAEFFTNEIGKRMLNSYEVKREIPFIIRKNANEIINTLDKNDIILVQGIIDCYFYEDDEVVLIDYKTDNIEKTGINATVSEYRPQILSYRDALKNITGKKVKSSYLYLFDIGQAILID